MNEKESLIDLSSDDSLKAKFQSSLSRPHFWISIKSEYPLLSEKAMKILIQFSTTYLCEKTFSSVMAIKTRNWSRLERNMAFCLAVTLLEPKIHKLISSKQGQISHSKNLQPTLPSLCQSSRVESGCGYIGCLEIGGRGYLSGENGDRGLDMIQYQTRYHLSWTVRCLLSPDSTTPPLLLHLSL
ncbi:hypothetical protein QTO34_014311, partial [Cnephaeus nilssonii]